MRNGWYLLANILTMVYVGVVLIPSRPMLLDIVFIILVIFYAVILILGWIGYFFKKQKLMLTCAILSLFADNFPGIILYTVAYVTQKNKSKKEEINGETA